MHLAAEIFDVVGKCGLALRARPGLDRPPSQVSGQKLAAQGLVGLAVDVDELLVAPCRMVPGAHAGADVPEVMMERAHLHDGRPLESLEYLENVFRAVVPAVFPAAQDILAVEGIQVDHVEAALVVRLGRLGGDLGQQRGIAIGAEEAKALLQMMHLRAGGMGGRRRAKAPRWQPVNA